MCWVVTVRAEWVPVLDGGGDRERVLVGGRQVDVVNGGRGQYKVES